MSNKLKGVIEDKGLKVVVQIAEAGPKGDKPAHRWVGTTQVQFENPDGTWGDVVDLNPEVVVMHQEQFEAIGEAQEVFTLTEGVYRPGTNALSWYMYGQKQPNEALNELSPSTFSIKGGVPEGAHILVEYLEFANVAIGLKGEKGDKGDQGIQGPPGATGADGKGLEFSWDGTRLGVRREGDAAYQYVDLKGEKGDVGLQGKSLEFSWNGTQLGIRAEGDSVYQYVDLEGPQGPEGPPGSDATVTQTNIEGALGYTPVSPTQLATKVDKVTGKGLSTEDYTTTEKTKLAGIESGANKYTHPATHPLDMITETTDKKIMTASERTKLSGIEAGAQVNKVTSVAGKTGAVTLTKLDIGLGNVDNTADLDKPISTAMQAALNGKVDNVRVLTDVPANAKFTDTVYEHPSTHSADIIVDGTTNKVFTAIEKTKLSGIEAGANNYTHPATHSADIIVDGTTNKVFTATEKTKLSNIEENANNYIHPTNHPPNIISQDSNNRFVTDAEKTTWDNKWDFDEETIKQVKVDNAANADTVNGKTVESNVPAGAKFTDTLTTINGKTGAITKADIVAIGIPAQDTIYSHPSTHPASMITETTTKRFVSDAEKNTWNTVTSKADLTYVNTELNKKVDKISGKGLSTEDYTSAEKTKLSGIEAGAEVNQNAFSNIKVGTTTIAADSKTDTLELTAGTGITLTPDATNDKVTVSVASAPKLTTARTISLSGDVSGSTSFDGSANVTITATVADDSHNHVISNIDGLQAALDAKETPSGAQTKADSALASAKNYTDAKVAGVVNSAPEALDTLYELAEALGNDPNFATTVMTEIGTKETPAGAQAKVDAHANLTNNPHSVTKSQVGLGSVSNYGLATQAEAEAGTSSAKYMTPLRTKQAIDALQAVKSVAGKTGTVTLTKGDVGLSNVDNTSDMDKPISTAVQTALDGKVDNSRVLTDVPVNAKFTDTVTTINGKTGAIAKADIVALGIPAQDTVYTHPDKHAISEVDGLQTALNGKVNTSQVLTNVPAGAVFTDTVTTINGKTGAITKADITALGIPAQDTVYTHPATHSADMIVDGTTNKAYTATEKDKLAGIETGANKTTIANNLTETEPGKALDATQGKALAEQISNSSGVKTARFVVGTSTSGWTEKDCDYLCDGTNDQEEIIQALNDLPATGGEVVILDGTYNITASINIPKDNVSIKGNGNATILKRMYNSTNTDSGPTAKGLISLNEKSGCKIQGLQIDGNKATYTASYNNGIRLSSSSSDNTVTGNTCNNSSYGIYLYSSSNNTVTGNTCNNSSYGIYLYSSSNNTVTGNTCNNNSSNGIYLSSSSNNTVTGNTCNNNNYGIRLSSSSSDNTVTGNTCNNSSYGIYLYSSSNNTVTGNTCNNNYYGIRLSSSSNNTVTGNACIRGTGQTSDYASDQYTIRLSGTGNNYNLISSNNCMGKAVVVGGGTGNTVINNKWNATSDFEDLRTDVGDKTTLTTTDKTNLVAAINEVKAQNNDLDANKVDNSRVLTDVPAGAVFTDTVTTINGKTGTITKADIVALGIPSQDTTYSEITTSEIDAGTSSTLRTITARRLKYLLDKIVALFPTKTSELTNDSGFLTSVTKSDVGLSNVDNVKQMPISGGVLENYREKLVTLSGTSTAINLSLGNVFTHTLSGNTTYSITNAVSGQAHSFTLIINQTATVRTLTFPSSVKWQGGEIPDLSGASKTYVLTFLSIDGGTTWFGMYGGEF